MEQHTHKEGFYLSRINEYHEGSRPSKEETENLLGRLIRRQHKQEQQQKDKELATESSQQTSEELRKQIEIKPEQLSKEKKGTMEKKPTLPEQQTMVSGRYSFKPPKPRTNSGAGQDKDPEVFEQWKQEVLDYYALTEILPSTQNQVLGYFVSGTAKDYYFITRNKQTDITLEEMLDGLKRYVIPLTLRNTYWKQWDAIHQIKNGKVQQISNVAIDINKIAQ